MNYLKIASAALAAFVMVGCSDKKGDCCGKSETCCEKKGDCCEAVVAQTVSPRFTAQADAVALIEPQAVIKTIYEIYESIKDELSEAERQETEKGFAMAKKLGYEDVTWISVSVDEFGDRPLGLAFSAHYPHTLASMIETLGEEAGEPEKIEIPGATEAYKGEGGTPVLAKVGDVLIAAENEAKAAEQIKLYTDGTTVATYADLQPSATGILNVKISSFGKALKITGNGSSAVNQVLPDGERLLKECGELTIKVTTEGAEISLEAGSVTDATTIKTGLDSVVMMAKMAYEEHKAELVAELPPAVKEQLPAVDAAVKSLACTQKGKVVTLSVKAEILKLAEALAPVVLSSASNR